MDTGTGEFKKISNEEFEKQIKKQEKSLVFRIGEVLEIRGSRFRVEKIQRKKMILKLLKQPNNHEG